MSNLPNSGARDIQDGMSIYWLEQTDADLPPGSDWLSISESLQLDHLRFAKRRADWRLGRWTAKRAVAICLGFSEPLDTFSKIQIRASASGAPEVFLDPELASRSATHLSALNISLSHSCGHALCAIVLSRNALGCDVEEIAPRSDAFVADFFTTEEQDVVAGGSSADCPRISTLIWSAKESALKALSTGLRLDTRSLSVSVGESSDHWHPLQVRHGDDQIFQGWWQVSGGFVRTMVSDHLEPNLPIQLE